MKCLPPIIAINHRNILPKIIKIKGEEVLGFPLVFFSGDYCSIFEEGICDTGARTAVSSGKQLPIQGSPIYSIPSTHPQWATVCPADWWKLGQVQRITPLGTSHRPQHQGEMASTDPPPPLAIDHAPHYPRTAPANQFKTAVSVVCIKPVFISLAVTARLKLGPLRGSANPFSCLSCGSC